MTDTAGQNDGLEVSNLLGRVGDRVRQARKHAAMSRRVLSERSGVSERYLAQLESGQGNISISLLLRVAHALDFEVELLIGREDPWTSETVRISQLMQNASNQQREQVLKLLEPQKAAPPPIKRIALIGLRGAGKSTLGAKIATRLDLPFQELNQRIEHASGMPVSEILALYGPEGYRLLEHQALEYVTTTQGDIVLAVAGGIVSQEATYSYLLDNFYTIWLRAEPEDHLHRVKAQGDYRPMQGNPDAITDLRKILVNREGQYRRANAWIDTAGQTVEQSLENLAEVINQL